jgi:hypothetical protein
VSTPDAEFYVGYLPTAPPRLARTLQNRVVALFFLVALAGAGLPLLHQLRPAARFEYGSAVQMAGTLAALPHPRLLVPRPGRADGPAAVSSFPLVAPWKHGADELVAGLDGRRVRLRATLAHRDGVTVAEVVPGSLRAEEEPPVAAPEEVVLGRRTLRGEIVDSKCFFGVMNPGELKPHRACAVRCLSGGIPPVLCVRDAAGRASYFWLLAADGSALGPELLEFVAEPVAIEGELRRRGEDLVLRADPSTYRRLE